MVMKLFCPSHLRVVSVICLMLASEIRAFHRKGGRTMTLGNRNNCLMLTFRGTFWKLLFSEILK